MEISGLDFLDIQLQRLVLGLVSAAAQNVKGFPQLAPVAFLDSAAGVMPILLDLGGGAEKDATVAALRDLGQKYKSRYIFSVIESWTILDEEAVKDYLTGKYQRVSEHPKAIKAVMMALETRDSGSYIAVVRIGANRVLDPKVEFMDATRSSGRFTNLLPKIFH
jgi:hypothetical protein